MVSGGGTNLQAILDAKGRGEMPNTDVCLVISSNRRAYALERARNAGIKALVIGKKKDETYDMYGQRLISAL